MPTDHSPQTFELLQRLDQGKMQTLGDRLLPDILPTLYGLKANGQNLEGKTTKGVPDSFVGDGDDPAKCSVAVEYTTQKNGLGDKLRGDYRGVRKQCPKASTIVLCTNRSTEHETGLDDLKNDAQQSKIDLQIIDGRILAKWLDEYRQDLRYAFLGIPIAAHTYPSLLEKAQDYLYAQTREQANSTILDRYIARPQAEQMLGDAVHKHPNTKAFLFVAPAGAGKTTWSIEHARRYVCLEPVFWVGAKDLPRNTDDPLGLAIVHAAYGTRDPSRLSELAQLLKQERRRFRMIIDGIDEASDYDFFKRGLNTLLFGALGPYALVLLTCREEALPLVEQALGGLFPELFRPWRDTKDAEGCKIHFDALSTENARLLLHKEGATPEQAQVIENALPQRYRTIPLFLVQSLKLLRAGKLPQNHEQWLPAFADHFVDDIQKRLREGGSSPSTAKIRLFLEDLAKRALEQPGAIVSEDELAMIPEACEEGENTWLGRSVQAGLLLRIEGRGIGFSHALFLEHFAAQALGRDQKNWEAWLLRARSESGRRVVVRIMPMLAEPLPALQRLLELNARAACEAAAQIPEISDGILREALLTEPRRLLKSRFPSDKDEGLRLMEGLKWPETRRLAAEWWNGLSGDEKHTWIFEGADLFLSLEMSGAFQVIVWHWQLSLHGITRYAPSFCRRLEECSSEFRKAIQEKAREQISITQNDDLRLRCIKLLAILRDSYIVDHLDKQMQSRHLLEPEHRALIHLNTSESISIYRKSIEQWLRHAQDIIKAEAAVKIQNWLYLVDTHTRPQSADFRMFPHDRLIELVRSLLAADSVHLFHIGRHWAELLAIPQLIEPFYEAYRCHYENHAQDLLRPRLIENIVERLPFSQIKELYDKYIQEDIHQDIVRYVHKAPGPATIAFLMDRLKEPPYQFRAIHSLVLLDAVSAGPAIHQILGTGSPDVRDMAIQALGELRYWPALGDLIQIARGLQNADQESVNLSYLAIQSLGRFGNEEAYSQLRRLYPIAKHLDQANSSFDSNQDHIIRALLFLHNAEGLSIAKDIAMHDLDMRPRLCAFLGKHSLPGLRPAKPIGFSGLHDDTLLDWVIEYVRDIIESGTPESLDFSIRSLAAFDSPRATEELERIASLPLSGNEIDKNSGLQDYVCTAREILAERGHPGYTRELVEKELGHIAQRNNISPWDIERFAQWNHALVREILWERVNSGTAANHSLYLLQWFALPADIERFQALEGHEDIKIADIAHRFLEDPGRFTRPSNPSR